MRQLTAHVEFPLFEETDWTVRPDFMLMASNLGACWDKGIVWKWEIPLSDILLKIVSNKSVDVWWKSNQISNPVFFYLCNDLDYKTSQECQLANLCANILYLYAICNYIM